MTRVDDLYAIEEAVASLDRTGRGRRGVCAAVRSFLLGTSRDLRVWSSRGFWVGVSHGGQDSRSG